MKAPLIAMHIIKHAASLKAKNTLRAFGSSAGMPSGVAFASCSQGSRAEKRASTTWGVRASDR